MRRGFPCCVRFPCVHAAATTPVQRLGVVFARVTQPCQPSPVPRPDRPTHRPFRGLLSVHLRCGLHTRTVTVCRDRYPKASDTSSPPCLLRSLPAGAVTGWGLHPLEKRRLVTAHVESGHSMTSSARPRIVCGTVRPSASAVFRLTTSSNLVGCTTGRSAGLVPSRIRPA